MKVYGRLRIKRNRLVNSFAPMPLPEGVNISGWGNGGRAQQGAHRRGAVSALLLAVNGIFPFKDIDELSLFGLILCTLSLAKCYPHSRQLHGASMASSRSPR